jgi:hypothetical protein
VCGVEGEEHDVSAESAPMTNKLFNFLNMIAFPQ